MVNRDNLSISIALCTYNGANHLASQLKSIIKQIRQPDEIIICDDCSKDESVEIAKDILAKWKGKWQVIVNDKNLGYRKNFQKAISLCHGDIIFLSDQDDVWDLNKIEVMVPVFKNKNVILAFHDAKLVNEKLETLYDSFWETMRFNENQILNGDNRLIYARNVMQGAACCFRKELFKLAEPFPVEAIHDEWLLLIGLSSGTVAAVAKPLLNYRQENNAVGGMPFTAKQKILKWHNSIRERIATHRKYLNNRQRVFELLIDRNKRNCSNNLFSIRAIEFNDFLIRRQKSAKHLCKPMNINKFISWYVLSEALKQWIKDWISYFFVDDK